MYHLFNYLLNKGYTTEEVENIIKCLEAEFKLPEKISKDIEEYTKLMGEANKNTLF